jgi:hypothetical protein
MLSEAPSWHTASAAAANVATPGAAAALAFLALVLLPLLPPQAARSVAAPSAAMVRNCFIRSLASFVGGRSIVHRRFGLDDLQRCILFGPIAHRDSAAESASFGRASAVLALAQNCGSGGDNGSISPQRDRDGGIRQLST